MKIEEIVEIQREYFFKGETKDIDFRLDKLEKIREYIEAHTDDILVALNKDLGKSSAEGYMTEVGLVLEELTLMKKKLKKWAKPKRRKSSLGQLPGKSYSTYEPYGVVLVMSPWNYPFLLTISPLIGAICAGNTVILKPSNYSSNTSSMIAKMILEIFDKKYVACVTGGREENTQLLNQRFDYIFFTGGVNVGRLVLEKASKNITPVTLELGGKSPCIIDRTANIKLAAKRVAFGKFTNAGQTCVAPDYILIDKNVKEEFTKYLISYIKEMYTDNVFTNKNFPHIINTNHFNRIKKLYENENILYGGKSEEETLKISPTIIDNINLSSPVMKEEIFGPVLPIMEFTEIEEVVSIVRTMEKPLALYFFTSDDKNKDFILSNISFGGGCINDVLLHMASANMGFGGVGQSGMGSYHGKKSFETFSHEKNILKQSTRIDMNFRYSPFSEKKEKLIRKLLK